MTSKIDLPTKLNIIEEEKGKKATIEIEPCFPGYGITLGNVLRRVMLSSMPGAAVTAVKIKDAQHEFMAVPGVKEDVLEIILNLKQLHLRVHSDEPVKLELKHKGEKKITAKDIKDNADVEIINKDLHLATLTDDKAEFEMEVYVDNGIGYVPTEVRDDKEKLEIGMIAVDAIYSPIQNVGINVENVRVGQMTNYDKLILNVETDGTITPKEAFDKSADLLMSHFNFFQGNEVASEEEDSPSAGSGPAEDEKPEEEDEKPKEAEEPAPKKRGRPKKVK